MPTTIESVVETHRGRGARDGTTGASYTRVFQVVLDEIDVEDVEKAILDHNEIPRSRAAHPTVAGMFVDSRRVSLEDDDDRLTWKVECSYSNKQGGGTDEEEGEIEDPDPWDLPAQITLGSSQYTRAVTRAYKTGDTEGNPSQAVLNSAGQPFDPPVVQEEENMVIGIQRNQKTLNPNAIKSYRNTINSGAMTIAGVSVGQHQGRMRAITASKAWAKDGTPYWMVGFDIEVKTDTHIRKVLDAGFYYLDGTDLKPIMDNQATPKAVTEPMVLDGSGAVGDKDNPTFLEFQTYWAASWSGLDLPTS